jgi:mRNA guanylyltransferase
MGHAPPQIPGDIPPAEIQEALREVVAGVLGRRQLGFPGAQPVSFGRRHFLELKERDYFLCEKTDGVRCLLWLDVDSEGNEAAYLIDRKNTYYLLPPDRTHFPTADDPTFVKCHRATLMDGELVYDTIEGPHGMERKLRYLVFDLLALEGENIMQKTLSSRLGKLRQFVTKPYDDWRAAYAQANPEYFQSLPFELVFKSMEMPYALTLMFKDKLRKLPHGNDGLIFTCQETPYTCGTDEHIIKWKPPHENTIDFRLNLLVDSFPTYDPEDGIPELTPDYDAMPVFELLVLCKQHEYQRFDRLFMTDEEWEAMKKINQLLDGRILECYRDEHGRWRMKREADGSPRFRDDKENPNHVSVVQKVLDSIADGVTEEELIGQETAIRAASKERQHHRQEYEKRRREQHMKREAEPVNGAAPKRIKLEE